MEHYTPKWFKDELDIVPVMEHHQQDEGTIWSIPIPFRTITDHRFNRYVSKVYILVRPDGNELWSKGEHPLHSKRAPGCSIDCVIGHMKSGSRGRKQVLVEDLPD